MKGGLPAAHSKRSGVASAHWKKSPSCTSAHGARVIASRAATGFCSIPTELQCAAMNRPSPHEGSNSRSEWLRTAQETSAVTVASGV